VRAQLHGEGSRTVSILPLPRSTISDQVATLPLGSVRPRIWTPPLRKLSPESSYGFAVIRFAADVLHMPLDPWQQWLVVHLGELLDDGRPRFRQALVLVARQNGKTHLCVVLALFWMFVERWGMVFGTSTNLEQAAEPWEATVEIALKTPALAARMPKDAVRKANGQQVLRTTDRSRYKIGAVNPKGGRGKSIDRLIGDELREHHDYKGYNAAYNAMNARPHGQAVYITNQGDDRSVVLNNLYDAALEYVTSNNGDYRLGVFDYSAPPGCALDDVAALAQANPNVGRRLDWDTILGPARRLSLPTANPEEVAGFRTEVMCQRVKNLDAAINEQAWGLCRVEGDLSELRSRLAACVDVSPDMRHASLVVAGMMPDDRVRFEVPGVVLPGRGLVVGAWSGPTAVKDMQRDLPAMIRKIRPQVFGWLPNGPAAAAAAGLKDRKGRTVWPPPGITVAEISGEVSAICMGLAAEVEALGVVHAGDPLLDAQALGAAKLHHGDVWRFERQGDGHVDSTYAVAGAVHLARTLPAPVGRPRFISSSRGKRPIV
jgi:hypothetical protein